MVEDNSYRLGFVDPPDSVTCTSSKYCANNSVRCGGTNDKVCVHITWTKELAARLNFIANGFIVWRLACVLCIWARGIFMTHVTHKNHLKTTVLGFHKTASSTHLWIRTHAHYLPLIVWSLCALQVSNLILNNIVLQDKIKYIQKMQHTLQRGFHALGNVKD